MVAISNATIRMITPSMMNDMDAPIEVCTGSVEKGPDVLASGTGTGSVGKGVGVVGTAKHYGSHIFHALFLIQGNFDQHGKSYQRAMAAKYIAGCGPNIKFHHWLLEPRGMYLGFFIYALACLYILSIGGFSFLHISSYKT